MDGAAKDNIGNNNTVEKESDLPPTRSAIHKFFYPNTHSNAAAAAAAARVGGLGQTARGGRVASDDEGLEHGVVVDEHHHGTEGSDDPNATFDMDCHHPDPDHRHASRQHGHHLTYPTCAHSEREEKDRSFVERFWTTYDDILILSLFTQLGIAFRLAVATWFTYFDNVFTNDSPLFTNLPLNCLSCFIMGLLCSGERLMEIIHTRFTPPELQHSICYSHQQQHPQLKVPSDQFLDEDMGLSMEPLHHGNQQQQEQRPSGSFAARTQQHRPPSSNSGAALSSVDRPSDNKDSNLADSDCNDKDDSNRAPTRGGRLSQNGHHLDGEEGHMIGVRRSDPRIMRPHPVHPHEDGDNDDDAQDDPFRDRSQMRHRFKPTKYMRPSYPGQNQSDDDEELAYYINNSNNKDRYTPNRSSFFHSWQPPVHVHEELRQVQLMALERRIRTSKCLVLFPSSKRDVDVMEHYFSQGYKRNGQTGDLELPHLGTRGGGRQMLRPNARLDTSRNHLQYDAQRPEQGRPTPRRAHWVLSSQVDDLSFDTSIERTRPRVKSASQAQSILAVATIDQQDTKPVGSDAMEPNKLLSASDSPADQDNSEALSSSSIELSRHLSSGNHDQQQDIYPHTSNSSPGRKATSSNSMGGADPSGGAADGSQEPGLQADLDQIFNDVTANVSENISRLRRVNLADGWDVGTSPDAMSEDLLLGLRDGFCGALSSFSSWSSTMVLLMREGKVGDAIVGYMLGLQLPILAYRFGQHVAVYIFVWRCRREARRDERRGYGIQVSMDDGSNRDHDDPLDDDDDHDQSDEQQQQQEDDAEMPSVRAIITALFVMAIVTQTTSLSFFSNTSNQQVAISLLFSPLGVLARWRLSKYNRWRPGFPIGTFTCNILACALSGSLGSLLAGNPGPRTRIVLVSFVNGFAGTLSSLATFVVEVLAGIDPILFRFDGVIYACLSVFWASVAGFVFEASVDWADQISKSGDDLAAVGGDLDDPTAALGVGGDSGNETRWI